MTAVTSQSIIEPVGPTTPYTREFFKTQLSESLPSAQVIVPIVMSLVRPTSVVDVGCGIGAWLDSFSNNGVQDYLGLDGDYVRPADLLIDPQKFRAADLSRSVGLERTFDLAVCLEVAEHLPARAARPLVALLTTAAPCVLFSAAVPNQGGTAHVNERWPQYWKRRFAEYDFVRLDPIRPRVWRDRRVHWWFKQNVYLYCRRDMVSANPALTEEAALAAECPFELVHSDRFDSLVTVEGMARRLPSSIWSTLCRWAGRD